MALSATHTPCGTAVPFEPLCSEKTLRKAHEDFLPHATRQEDIPLIVLLGENPAPRYCFPFFFKLPRQLQFLQLFPGAAALKTHDPIHHLLGAPFNNWGEAIVLGFTAGTTLRFNALRREMFVLMAQHLYRGVYRFNTAQARIFREAAHLGAMGGCSPLAEVDHAPLQDLALPEARRLLGVPEQLLLAYYRVLKRRHPEVACFHTMACEPEP